MTAAAAAAAADGACALQTAEQVAKFLSGRWALRRRLRYSTGGASGRVSGTAEFAQARAHEPAGGGDIKGALLYSETGTLHFDQPPAGMPADGLSISQRYAVQCDRWPVAVHFVERNGAFSTLL